MSEESSSSAGKLRRRAIRNPAVAVLHIVLGPPVFLIGLGCVALLSLAMLGEELVTVPVLSFIVLSLVGGIRTARGKENGFVFMLLLFLLTGFLPGFLGTFGAGSFLQGVLFFVNSREHGGRDADESRA